MESRATSAGLPSGRVNHPELYRALRGIWTLEGEEFVVEIDQETGGLMACDYRGEAMDPRWIVTRGVLVRPFEEPLVNEGRDTRH
jgi:hypothetical protein